VALLLTFNSFCVLSADENGHQKGHRHNERFHKDPGEKRDRAAEIPLKPVIDPAYKETCGACHFTYQPELLPSGSWVKILDNIKEHFGEGIDIDTESRRIISKYLVGNAGEYSRAHLPAKIMESLRGQTPSQIIEIPYIRHKHQDIPCEVFSRKAVGSLSNCSACHRTADQGMYNGDDVVIPE